MFKKHHPFPHFVSLHENKLIGWRGWSLYIEYLSSQAFVILFVSDYMFHWDCFVGWRFLFCSLSQVFSKNGFHITWYWYHFTITRRVPLLEQERLNLPEHLISSTVTCGVHIVQSLVFGVFFLFRSFSNYRKSKRHL